jgi:hypothetical protein
VGVRFRPYGWGWLSECERFTIRDQSTKEVPCYVLWRLYKNKIVPRTCKSFDNLERAMDYADYIQDDPLYERDGWVRKRRA